MPPCLRDGHHLWDSVTLECRHCGISQEFVMRGGRTRVIESPMHDGYEVTLAAPTPDGDTAYASRFVSAEEGMRRMGHSAHEAAEAITNLERAYVRSLEDRIINGDRPLPINGDGHGDGEAVEYEPPENLRLTTHRIEPLIRATPRCWTCGLPVDSDAHTARCAAMATQAARPAQVSGPNPDRALLESLRAASSS